MHLTCGRYFSVMGACLIFVVGSRAVAQSLVVSPNPVAFSATEVGSTATLDAQITNWSADIVTVGPVVIQADIWQAFAILTDPQWTVLVPGETVTVGLSFSPQAVSPPTYTAFLFVTAASPVLLTGTGVEGGGAGPDAEELLAGAIDLFETLVDDGRLTGSGPGRSAQGRLRALGNKLTAALELVQAGEEEPACEQLKDAFRRVDGDPKPPDFADGPARAEMADSIQEVIDAIQCP